MVGVGAVGGYFGGRLAAQGHEVHFIARAKTLAALRQDGLHITSLAGDLSLTPDRVRATSDPQEIGPTDAVLLAVKTWQVEPLAASLRPLVSSGGVVLPLQNGVEAPTQLAAVLGRERVLGGLCRIMAQQVAPAHIRHFGAEPEIILGPLPGAPGEVDHAAARLAQALRGAGVRCQVSDRIVSALWEKLAFMAAFGGVGAAARGPAGVLRHLPETRALLTQAVEEVYAVAAGLTVPLPVDLPARVLSYIDGLPAAGTSSLQRDITSGAPSELEALVGAIVRLGAAAAVPTPVFRMLYACLLPQEQVART